MNSRSGDLEQQVRAAFDGKLADVAFEGTGFGSALNNAIDCVRPFATVVMVGNPAGDTTIGKVQHSKILRKELTINGIWNSHFSNLPINEWRYTVDMLDKGIFRCADLISHTTDLDGLPGLIDDVKNHRVNACKVLYVDPKNK